MDGTRIGEVLGSTSGPRPGKAGHVSLYILTRIKLL